jgi:hypothetical protein
MFRHEARQRCASPSERRTQHRIIRLAPIDASRPPISAKVHRPDLTSTSHPSPTGRTVALRDSESVIGVASCLLEDEVIE